MDKRKVTGDDLRAMMHSRKTLPELDRLDTEGCWLPLVEDYRTELLVRQITRLRREKALLLDITEYARTMAELYDEPEAQSLIERRLDLIKGNR